MESKRYHAQAGEYDLRIYTNSYLTKVIVRFLILLSFCLFSPLTATGARVSLGWDANTDTETYIAGYKVYYNFGFSGPPYVSTLDIPISKLKDPNNPAYTTIPLEDNEIISFSCTAYNTLGRESDFSEEVYALKIIERTIDGGIPLEITLPASDFDGNTLTYTVVALPAHGTISGTGPNYIYTPETNYHSHDTITFKANEWNLTVLASINGATAMPWIPLLLLDD